MKSKITFIIWCICFCSALKTVAQPMGWSYSQPITATNTTAALATNYQLKLILNTQTPIAASQMLATGNDIRFGKDCAGATLFNYWIESGINTTTTTIWVKLDSLPASGAVTLYLFYGNTSAAAVSAVPGVFVGPNSSTDSVASGAAGGVGDSQRGFRFASTEDILVTHFGKREPTGTTRYLTLFDYTTQAIVRQIQVGGPAAQYSYGNISPIWLTSGTQYVLELFQGVGDGYYFGTSSQIGQQLTYYDMRYCNSCTQNTFPTNVLSNYHYGYPDLWYFTKTTLASLPTVVVGAASGPTSTTLGASLTICSGNSTTLTAMGGYTLGWYSALTGGTYLGGGSSFTTPILTSTTTFYVQDSSNCAISNRLAITVTVNPLPTVTAISSAAGGVCTGTMVTLTGGGTATSYVWDNAVMDAIPFVPPATTTYMVTGTGSNGCTNTASTTVIVNALPVITATPSAAAICSGSLLTLTGGGAATYVWDNSVIDGVAFTASTTTTYNVVGTDVNGCSNVASVLVTVNGLPTVAANSSVSGAICAGTNVTLTGSGSATAYIWDNAVINAIPFISSTTTTYNVIGTDINGCTNTASILITVNALPTVMATSSALAVCIGGTVTLTGGGASSYTWDNSVADGVAFTPTATVTYNVTGTDINGCTNTDSITVTANALPTVIATTSASAVCTGGAVTLTGGGATSYTWDNSVVNAVAFTPAATITYNVTGTDINGCMNTDSITVTVNALPIVTATSTGSAVCLGTMVTLTGGGASTYNWDNSVVNAVGFSPTATTTYNVIGTDATGCSNTASTTVIVNPLPPVTLPAFASICLQASPFPLTGGSPAGGVYSGTGVTGGVFSPSVSGVGSFPIAYTVTDSNACSNSFSSNMPVVDCTGITEEVAAQDVNVYPNPTNGMFNIIMNNANYNELLISIVDVQGKEVYASKNKNVIGVFNKQIDLRELSKGVYFIKMNADSILKVQKLIIQ
jgi:Ig-like domain CHU_C associated/Secretion system C-terminal sorting domain/Domain of unknown function (DUF2341)